MKIDQNKIIGIIGLGYVGLPLLMLINKKFKVFGFDNDKTKIKMIKENKSYNSDIPNKEFKSIKKDNIYLMEKSLEKISKCNYLILCLPTPLKNDRPDMSYLQQVFKKIYPFLVKNQTIILESSVYPGATEEIFLKKLQQRFKIGKNFFLAYSPERIDPGTSAHANKMEYQDITKLVSGYSKSCEKKILHLYESIFKKIFLCKSIMVAETSKVFENIFRVVNIGLVNEMKILTNKLNINIHDVVDAAGTKPFGFKKFSPGPGIGGHCIPIDPVFMQWVAKKNKQKARFIDLGTKMNIEVNDWTVQKIIALINKKKISKLLIVGVAYKADINDIRESPSIKIFKKLIKIKMLDIEYTDPYIPNLSINKRLYYSANVKNYKKYDYIVICTDHSNVDYKKIKNESKMIIDTRGVYKNSKISKIIHL
jgi:UDP-N-acetyl-D-glucosamine dehydrogenase